MSLGALLQVVVALSTAQTAVPVRPSAQSALKAAVQLFESFQDEKAAAALRELLVHSPPAAVAARAHIYLALIALNGMDSPRAKAEFVKAVATEVLVDLPQGQSPKAQILFAEARRDVASAPPMLPDFRPAPASPAPFSPAPFTPSPFGTGTSATAENGAGHGNGATVAAWVTGSLALATLGTGIGFGVAQSSAKNGLPGGSTPVTVASQATSLGQTIARDGLVADVLFGVGGAAAIASLILFLVPSGSSGSGSSSGSGDASPSASLSLGVGPVAVQLGGRW